MSLEKTEGDPEHRDLELVFSVKPNENCPVRQIDRPILDLSNHASEDGFQCEITYRDEDDSLERVIHYKQPVSDPCPALSFRRLDCVPRVLGVENERIHVQTRVATRERIGELLSGIAEVSEEIRIHRIARAGTQPSIDQRVVDLSTLTDKQRVVMETAIAKGFFRQPRGVTLTEIAEQMELSQPVVSQHLHAAEQKVWAQIFDDIEP